MQAAPSPNPSSGGRSLAIGPRNLPVVHAMNASRPLDLDRLLAPCSAATFLDQHFERGPLYLSGDARRHEGLFDLDCVDDLLARGFFSSDQRFGVFRDGVRMQPPFLRQAEGFGPRQREVALASWVRERHLAGDTVAAYAIENQFRPLGRLARSLGRALQARVDIGLYLTPKGSRGLAPHWDYMDVFVLQIEGHKRWRLYGTDAELPIKPRGPVLTQPRAGREPTADHLLGPGDVLYLPRGTTHEVQAEETQSLHLTIGIHRLQWHELLAQAMYAMAESNVDLRDSVPGGADELVGRARALLEQCARDLDPETLLALCRRRTIPDAPLPDRQLDCAMAHHTEVDDHTRVTKRAGMECFVEAAGEQVVFGWPGSEPATTIRAPHQVGCTLRFIAGADRDFAVGELPGNVTPDSKRVLVRRLIHAGVLKPVESAEGRHQQSGPM